MFQEFERVVLTVDVPYYGLTQGDIGTIVLVHDGGKGYEIEFTTLDGGTIAVVSLFAEQVRPVRQGEIAHARMIELAQSAD